jgi:curved DNA-binding protein CbpA/polyhydroxyalkanoate synthesis regulator phasin
MNDTLSLAGEIKDMTLPWFFQGLHAEKKTGTAVITRETTIKKVYFSGGDIIFASSNLREDWLGEWLARAGTITREQCDASAELVQHTGKKQGAILAELGFIGPKDLVDGVKYQIRQIIISLFNWREGNYLFEEGPPPTDDIIPLEMSTGNLIIEGLKGLDWQVVRKSLPRLKTIIRPAVDPMLLFQGANLDQDHRAVFSLIDGNRTIEEICCLSGIGDFNTLKALYVLLALRMVESGEIKSEKEKKFVCEMVRETIAPAQEKHAEPKAAPTITKEELVQARKNLEQQNYYEALGIGRNAAPQEMKKAYFTLAKLYHPDRHFNPEMTGMKETLETLFTAIHDAYETLSDQVKRDQYDLVLMSGGNKPRAAEGARAEQRSDKERAVDQFNEGMKQFKAGNFWGAEEAFHWAMRLDPGNAEYVFHRGINLARIPRRGHEAEEEFVKAIKMAPSKIEYSLELGNFFARSGLKAKALSVYQDALKRNPNSEKIKQAIQKISEGGSVGKK